MKWFNSSLRFLFGPASAVAIAASSAEEPGPVLPATESKAKKFSGISKIMAAIGALAIGIIFALSAFSNGESSNKITARLNCPIPGKVPENVSKAVAFKVGPTPCDYAELGDICRTLIMTEITCTWDGLELGGQTISKSLWHGQGYTEGDGSKSVVTSGYDWGVAANGDNYLSRWTETMAPELIKATWTLVSGTGSLQGITGVATIECEPPKPTDSVEECVVTGSYTLDR